MQLSPSLLALDGQHGSVERMPGEATPAPPATQEEPIVTMAPHHSNGRYWLSGQANIIFQGNLPFHSPYEGTNSFHNAAPSTKPPCSALSTPRSDPRAQSATTPT